MMRLKKLCFALLLVFILFAGCTSPTQKTDTEKTTKQITKEERARITQQETDRITDEITKKETERITEEITQKEIDRIVKERTKQITEQILGSTNASDTKKEVPCDLTPTQRKFNHDLYYTGPLIDAHLHMPVFSQTVSSIAIQSGFQDTPAFDNELSSDYFICLFKSEGISKTFGFYIAPNVVLEQSINGVKDIEERHPGKIVAFYMPTPIASLNPDVSQVEKIILENKGVYKGIGEIKVAFSEVPNADPEDSEYLALYEIADRHHLIVMLHPNSNNKEATDRVLTKYPNVKFLLHGGDSESWIADLMKNHKNVYYSIDASITSLYGFSVEHQIKSPGKEKWLEYMNQNFDSKLDEAITTWKPIIKAYPDRFTWGTDRWYRWQFDAEVGAAVEEFGRSFIGELDPSVQDKFAYKNAERLLEEG